jgi:hypothetical protein
MKVHELITRLSKFNPELDVMILDGSNGAGAMREVNYGPGVVRVQDCDVEDSADCEGMAGKDVIRLGYGCY